MTFSIYYSFSRTETGETQGACRCPLPVLCNVSTYASWTVWDGVHTEFQGTVIEVKGNSVSSHASCLLYHDWEIQGWGMLAWKEQRKVKSSISCTQTKAWIQTSISKVLRVSVPAAELSPTSGAVQSNHWKLVPRSQGTSTQNRMGVDFRQLYGNHSKGEPPMIQPKLQTTKWPSKNKSNTNVTVHVHSSWRQSKANSITCSLCIWLGSRVKQRCTCACFYDSPLYLLHLGSLTRTTIVTWCNTKTDEIVYFKMSWWRNKSRLFLIPNTTFILKNLFWIVSFIRQYTNSTQGSRKLSLFLYKWLFEVFSLQLWFYITERAAI